MDMFLWIGIAILLVIVELMTVNLTTIWYIASAILSLIFSLFTESFLLQFGIFVVVGTVLVILTKPITKKITANSGEATNLDRVIGMDAIVTEEIDKNQVGEVSVDGKKWSAIADEKIDVNCVVKVLSIDGVKLKVERKGE